MIFEDVPECPEASTNAEDRGSKIMSCMWGYSARAGMSNHDFVFQGNPEIALFPLPVGPLKTLHKGLFDSGTSKHSRGATSPRLELSCLC